MQKGFLKHKNIHHLSLKREKLLTIFPIFYNTIIFLVEKGRLNLIFVLYCLTQLSNIYDRELYNNRQQLLIINCCCIAPCHKCFLDSLIDLYIFKISNRNSFFTIKRLFHNQETFPQSEDVSIIKRLFHEYKSFLKAKSF